MLWVGVSAVTGAWGLSPVVANIGLEWRPSAQTVNVNDPVNIGLYAVSDSSADQLLSAADVIFSWDPVFLDLLGNDNTGGAPLLVSGFPAVEPYNLNESVPPQDGDGFYLAYAFLGSPVAATPAGTLLTTFQFLALAETPGTDVVVEQTGGSPQGHTAVYDGTVPALEVTGALGSATVTIVPEPSTLTCLALSLLAVIRRRG